MNKKDQEFIKALEQIKKPPYNIITPELMKRYFSRYLKININDIREIYFCSTQRDLPSDDMLGCKLFNYFYFVIVAHSKGKSFFYNLSEGILSKELKTGCDLTHLQKDKYQEQIYFHSRFAIYMKDINEFEIYRFKMR